MSVSTETITAKGFARAAKVLACFTLTNTKKL